MSGSKIAILDFQWLRTIYYENGETITENKPLVTYFNTKRNNVGVHCRMNNLLGLDALTTAVNIKGNRSPHISAKVESYYLCQV